MALTLADANQIVQGALDKAKEMNIRISVAVCDAGGRLVAFSRMDGAIWASVYGCQGKAIASVAFARPSGELAERAGSPIIQGIAAAEGGPHDPEPGRHADHPAAAWPRARAAWAAARASRTRTAPARASPSC